MVGAQLTYIVVSALRAIAGDGTKAAPAPRASLGNLPTVGASLRQRIIADKPLTLSCLHAAFRVMSTHRAGLMCRQL